VSFLGNPGDEREKEKEKMPVERVQGGTPSASIVQGRQEKYREPLRNNRPDRPREKRVGGFIRFGRLNLGKGRLKGRGHQGEDTANTKDYLEKKKKRRAK